MVATPLGAPSRVDLREPGGCFPYPEAQDQRGLEACVAHALGAAVYCLMARAGRPAQPPAGAAARLHRAADDGGRGVTLAAAEAALRRLHGADMASLGLRLERLPNSAEAVRARLREGTPVLVGYETDAAVDAFHASPAACAALGHTLPRPVGARTGGHAVLLVGYDDGPQQFLARSSWGPRWGLQGHMLLPYALLEDEAVVTAVLGFVSG